MELFRKIYEKKIKNLTIWDFSIIKSTSVIFGIILGAFAHEFVLKNLAVITLFFLIGTVYLFWNILIKK